MHRFLCCCLLGDLSQSIFATSWLVLASELACAEGTLAVLGRFFCLSSVTRSVNSAMENTVMEWVERSYSYRCGADVLGKLWQSSFTIIHQFTWILLYPNLIPSSVDSGSTLYWLAVISPFTRKFKTTGYRIVLSVILSMEETLEQLIRVTMSHYFAEFFLMSGGFHQDFWTSNRISRVLFSQKVSSPSPNFTGNGLSSKARARGLALGCSSHGVGVVPIASSDRQSWLNGHGSVGRILFNGTNS